MDIQQPFDPSSPPSERLRLLLRYAKKPNANFDWQGVVEALGDHYHPEMRLTDVIHHLSESFAELLTERRFGIGGNGRAAEELLLSPITGHHAMRYPKALALDTQCSVEEFYNSISHYVLGQFSIAAIGWCRAWYDGHVECPA